jgi:hypothetical protein
MHVETSDMMLLCFCVLSAVAHGTGRVIEIIVIGRPGKRLWRRLRCCSRVMSKRLAIGHTRVEIHLVEIASDVQVSTEAAELRWLVLLFPHSKTVAQLIVNAQCSPIWRIVSL